MSEELIIISTKQPARFHFIASLTGTCRPWITVLSVIQTGNPRCDGNVILKSFPVIPVPLDVFDRLDFARCSWEIIDVKGSVLDRYVNKGNA